MRHSVMQVGEQMLVSQRRPTVKRMKHVDEVNYVETLASALSRRLAVVQLCDKQD